MSITVVGSIAFDAVKTPFGERERMLGGAATHFALAASFFDTVRVVGPVGDDFGDAELEVLATRGTEIDDVERVPGGKSFFWAGEYGWDLNSRETLATELGVFEQFQPKLSEASRECEVLFLANIQPELQLQVLEACRGPRFVALDSMNLWIDIAKDALLEVIRRVDCVILNDAELRQLTGKPSLLGAARAVLELGPQVIVAKQGEYGVGSHQRRRVLRPARLSARDGGRPDRRRGHLRRRLRRPHRPPPRRAAEPPGAAPGHGLRNRARLLQRGGVRHRAGAAPDRRRDPGAGGRPAADDPLRRRSGAGQPLMAARVIDGRAVAQRLREEVAAEVAAFTAEHGRPPGLATVLIGEDPASAVYVAGKHRACAEVGIAGVHRELGAGTSQAEALAVIDELNADPAVSGILCQLPVPEHLDGDALTGRIVPDKDVDGLSIANAGRLALGLPGLRPCTPAGVMVLLEEAGAQLGGARAVVVGRSNLFGKPMAQLLLAANATVTVCHSRTRDLSAVCREADVLIAAVGRPEMVRGDWVAPGAVVIDVGINRTESGLVGDVAFAEAAEVASAITPVPGGVGPMTIACLMRNTLQAARMQSAPRG